MKSGLGTPPPEGNIMAVKCACGKSEIFASGALIVTAWRCPLCTPKPKLRLVS